MYILLVNIVQHSQSPVSVLSKPLWPLVAMHYAFLRSDVAKDQIGFGGCRDHNGSSHCRVHSIEFHQHFGLACNKELADINGNILFERDNNAGCRDTTVKSVRKICSNGFELLFLTFHVSHRSTHE